MSDWYFEKNGESAGPVSDDELNAMLANGIISLTNLVWTADFGSEWKRLGDTKLAPPLPAAPPPLPPKEQPTLPPKPEQPASEPNGFLDSELTKALIGKKQGHHLAKFRTILAKAGGDPAKIATTRSWNWPALFLPYGWLLYRRMYVLGGIVLAVQLAYVLLPDSVPTSVARAFLFATFGLGVAFALYGNAWYLDIVRKRWEALRQEPDQAAALAKARQTGGVNLVAPIIAFALVLAAAVVPHLDLLSSNDPVAQVRDGHMTAYPTTTVGKAFAGNFDDGEWRSFTTPKGQRIVEFTGKINAPLHETAERVLFDSAQNIRKGVSSKIEADLLEANYYLNIFQLAYRDLNGNPALKNLQQKWACAGIERADLNGGNSAMVPSCGEHTLNFLIDAIGEWAEQSHWPTGTPVTVQWTVEVSGDSFEVSRLYSRAWDGKEQDHILDILFK
nr:GYF domain-containing protein [Methylobacterium sp. ZNC0032]